MRYIFNKIPRGIIYHTLFQSIKYVVTSFFMPLSDKNKVSKFENKFAEYCGVDYCVAFPFARTAIYYALKNNNFPSGSKVILSPVTIKGIVDVVLALDLVPIYVDWDFNTLNFKIEELQRKIDHKTKAVIITTLFGLVPNMNELTFFFRRNDIFIIEDFSQCLNGNFEGKRIGTFGDVGIYSSSSIKTLDTLGGGLAITGDIAIYDALRKSQSDLLPVDRKFLIKKSLINFARNIATSRLVYSLIVFYLLQIMRKANPGSTLKQTGSRNKDRVINLPDVWFSSYSSLQADIGISNIDSVAASDQIRIRNANYLKLNCGLNQFPKTTLGSANVYWQLIMLQDPSRAQEIFARHGVDTATTSLELVSDLEKYPSKSVMPIAENYYFNGIFLPCFPGLSKADLDRIANAIRELIGK